MKRHLHWAVLALAVAAACSTSQVTRTTQNRPTTPPSPTVRTSEAGVIPAGTEFSVRANETINTNQVGGTYRAEVAQTIEDANGRVLVPAGSAAELTVVDARSGGTVGSRQIELAIRSVTVNGKRYMINSEARTEGGPAGIGTNRRTGEMVGGGAAIGALIGAIAGGGKGAAVGAAVGAAGGAATQVLTRGDTVKIPAETVMSFRTSESWRLG
ncbi:MAG: hypothetical protein H6509_00940 [Bryobacterales bacterium]|nr:hypothetical protein [Acidobacteriota bacterium]MCB9383150.1 hypothetical protein [Bryobacterales bacterium]